MITLPPADGIFLGIRKNAPNLPFLCLLKKNLAFLRISYSLFHWFRKKLSFLFTQSGAHFSTQYTQYTHLALDPCFVSRGDGHESGTHFCELDFQQNIATVHLHVHKNTTHILRLRVFVEV